MGPGCPPSWPTMAYRISPGTLYPLLHDLEDGGLVVSRDRVERGRVLRYYTATGEGRRTLTEARSALAELVAELLSSADRADTSQARGSR